MKRRGHIEIKLYDKAWNLVNARYAPKKSDQNVYNKVMHFPFIYILDYIRCVTLVNGGSSYSRFLKLVKRDLTTKIGCTL